jgi:hypothetical protein
MRGIRGVAAAGVAAVSALALAACGPLGSSASDDKPGDSVGDKAAPTAAQTAKGLSGAAHAITALDLVKKTAAGVHSAKVDSTITMGTVMSMSNEGALDWADGLVGDMTITYTGGTVADSLRQAGASTTMAARYLPDAYYVNLGSALAAQAGGKHWVKYTYADLGKFTGSSGSYLKDTIQNNNPVKSVDAVLASPDIKNVGTENVRGIMATHYSGTIDVAAMTGKSLPNLSAADQAQLKDLLAKSGISTETVDLWVSGANLPVEAVVTASTKTGPMKTTTYYSDFGAPVSVKAPALSDTVNVSDLINQ